MQIRKLDVFGFKSFADRTEFVFDKGVTCIVGPNGCGKSNVVDAVKWILGEQSAKSLRGNEMSDVIFNGASGRHALGFAEATLTFDNTSGRLPLDASEVAITRRLYRSGESEYMINRKLCRLKDIRELFMDTGIGLNAYSLIEQGRVDVLLQSNPQERRAVFEEAAGISKYKARKKEALRKLERSEQNLLRLTDIIEEVERRLRSVKLQAGKARNWQAYSERLRELRVTHALHEYHQLTGRRGELNEAYDGLSVEHSRLQEEQEQLEGRRVRLESALLELEESLRQVDGELMELRGEVSSSQSTISHYNTRIAEWQKTAERDRRRIGELESRVGDLALQISQDETQSVEVEAELHRRRSELESAEQTVSQAQQAVRETSAALEEEKSALLELVQRASDLRNRISSTELRSENLAAQRQRLERRQEELLRQVEELAGQQAALESEIGRLDTAIERDQSQLNVRKEEARLLNAEAEEIAGEMAAAREFRSGLMSRRSVLEDLERRGEGVEKGVRRVLELSRQGFFPGIRGLVAELITVDVRYASLVEAALGEAEQYLVIDRRSDVMDSLEKLEEALEHRAGFLPLDALQSAAPAAIADGVEGVVARASDLVECPPELRGAIDCLLGRTLLVNDLATAIELARGPLAGMRLVTMAGETLESEGTMRLGRVMARAGLISRRSELRDIGRQLEEVEGRILNCRERAATTSNRIQELDQQQRDLRSSIYDASTSRVDVSAQLRRFNETAESIRKEQPLLESEMQEIDAQLAELLRHREEVAGDLAAIEEQSVEQRSRIEAMSVQVRQLDESRAAADERRTQHRVELAQVEEKRRSLLDRLNHLRTAHGVASRQRQEAGEELAACGSRVAEAELSILRQESKVASLYVAKEAAGRRSRSIGAERRVARSQVAAVNDARNRLQQSLHELSEGLHEAQMNLRECGLRMDGLRQRIQEDFDLDLEQKVAEYEGGEVDWASVEEEIASLRSKIERLGSVNLEAINEQQELEERSEFLHRQQVDLEAARQKLDDLIGRINHESETRFRQTFDQVRENFQNLFRKLFGGGKADIVLMNPEDVLESGIEIIARPPGKQPCSISLLSGGEKTMTAVALLMAVFRSKPSPFCILDEVDAALDEANNERFNDIVREFVRDSQFIVITHSKRTMAVGDVLYGVTMQEPGVSKKISVRFSDVHNLGLDLEDDAAASRAAGA